MKQKNRLFDWLGLERNARAIGALLAIGGAAGAVLTWAWLNIVAPQFPALDVSAFGNGYRLGARIAALEAEVAELQRENEAQAAARELEREMAETMMQRRTPEELIQRLRDSKF